jgi:hypothetical protein
MKLWQQGNKANRIPRGSYCNVGEQVFDDSN